MTRSVVPQLLVAFALVSAAPALRAEPRAELAAVEDAYREVDFEAVRRLAENAIHSGGQALASMARLEFLLGVANAALDHEQEAKRAFIVLLGIDPGQKLDRELSPRLRAPYLEARGFWSSNHERLSASVRAEASQLWVSLSDPAKMVSQVRVRFRTAGQREYRESLQPNAETLRVVVPGSGAQELECAITLLDEFGNTLGERGTNLAPLRLRREALGRATSDERLAQSPAAHGPNYLLPGALVVLGAASTATGVYFHVQRERAAREWNGRACEQPGATRGEQCGDVERRLRQDEWLTVGLCAGGGALLTLGVVSWIANQARSHEQAAVSCDAVATSTLGVWCAGRF